MLGRWYTMSISSNFYNNHNLQDCMYSDLQIDKYDPFNYFSITMN